VGARPSHVAEKKRAPTEGRPYKLGHYKPSSAEGAAQIDYAKRCRPFGPQFHFEACNHGLTAAAIQYRAFGAELSLLHAERHAAARDESRSSKSIFVVFHAKKIVRSAKKRHPYAVGNWPLITDKEIRLHITRER